MAQRRTWLALAVVFFGTTDTSASLPAGENCSLAGVAAHEQVGEFLFSQPGAAGAVADLDANGVPELLLVGYSLSISSISGDFTYKVGWDVNERTGVPARWESSQRTLSGITSANRCDVGAAVADLNHNGKPDLVVSTYAERTSGPAFVYRIGWDLDVTGRASSESALFEVAGFGDDLECSGSGLGISDLDGNGSPEMVLMAYVGPAGGRPNFRYRILGDLDATGAAVVSRSGNVNGIEADESFGADVVLTDVDLDGRVDILFGAYVGLKDDAAFRYLVGWSVTKTANPIGWSRWFQMRGMGDDVSGLGLALMDDPEVGPRLLIDVHRHPTASEGHFRYLAVPLLTSGAYFGEAQDPPPAIDNALRVPSSASTLTPARLLNLNMGRVRNTAEDALAEFLFGCWLVEVINGTASPVCTYGPPGEGSFGRMLASDRFTMVGTPDAMVAAVAWYVDSYMGWVDDEITDWVLNEHNSLNYYSGAENVPAFYTIRYTDPSNDADLITELESQNAEWALAYNDTKKYHGDCEDHAILRHALLRSLGFDRDWIWNVNAPSHQFNMVLYRGAWRLMDYGPIGRLLDRPASINARPTSVWNSTLPATSSAAARRAAFQDDILYRVYPDRCGSGAGHAFTRYAYPDAR